MILVSIVCFILLSVVNCQDCIYSSTECTCVQQPAGNMCLRYSSGSLGSEQCESYGCGSGYVCDCSGTETCDVTDCSSSKEVYRPTGSAPTMFGEVVGCEKASQVTCVDPKISMTPTPSSSPVPSPSAMPSTTSSPTPSQPIVALGADCDSGSICESGASCNCVGKCAKNVNITATGFGDASLELWMCGSAIGPATTDSGERLTIHWSGTCSDLYFRIPDEGDTTAMVASVRDNSNFAWYSTSLDGSGLTGTYVVSPPNTSFMTDPNYDFSAWNSPINSTLMSGLNGYKFIVANYDADLWTYRDNVLPNTFQGIAWYRAPLPFCYA